MAALRSVPPQMLWSAGSAGWDGTRSGLICCHCGRGRTGLGARGRPLGSVSGGQEHRHRHRESRPGLWSSVEYCCASHEDRAQHGLSSGMRGAFRLCRKMPGVAQQHAPASCDFQSQVEKHLFTEIVQYMAQTLSSERRRQLLMAGRSSR